MSYISDILEQPSVLHAVLARYRNSQIWEFLASGLPSDRYQQVVLTGMGGSYYALFPTWLYLNQHGVPTIHMEASELIHYALEMLNEKTLLVVASQSGESIEIQRLIQAIGSKVTTVSVTNSEDNFLANHSSISLFTCAGAEVPVATKTYTSSLALLHLLARRLTGQLKAQDWLNLAEVADQMSTVLKGWQEWLKPIAVQLQSTSCISLLGRGPAIASAMSGALVLREAARLTGVVGLSGGQFRHGPMEAVSPSLGVILFASQRRTWELSYRLALDIASHGGRVVLVGQEVADPAIVSLPLPLTHDYLSPMVEIVPVQLLALRLAENASITPGEFRRSGKVISTE